MEKHRGRSNDPQLSPHLHNTAKKIPPHAKKSRHHDPHRRQKSLIFISCKRVHLILEHEYQEKKLKVTTRYNILNFPALFSVLAVEKQWPGGQNGRPTKSAGKFKMLYRVLTLRFFLLKFILQLCWKVYKFPIFLTVKFANGPKNLKVIGTVQCLV